MLSAALVAAALVAGAAGSWSPCGLSMIETLDRSRAGALTFALGALGGGAFTFGGLAWLGDTIGLGGAVAAAVAVAALLVAALGDAAGRRIVPQVRRQVPESWRRVLSVPAAAALYGVLLGLGFTTFLLTFATWALATACLAIGTPLTGLLVGLAFGAGRAVPVAILSVRADGAALLGERPQALRALRVVVAAALVASAAVLIASPPAARAVPMLADEATDPSAAGGLVAYHQLSGPGILVRKGVRRVLPGRHPAVAGRFVAWLHPDGRIFIADAKTLFVVYATPAPGADALAFSTRHLVWRAGRKLQAIDLRRIYAVPRTVATARRGESIGRPAVSGDRLVYDLQSTAGSRIVSVDLERDRRRTLRTATGALLLHPALRSGRLLYVRSTATRQELLLGDRVVYSTTPTARRDTGVEPGLDDHGEDYAGERPADPERPAAGRTVTLWSTALGPRAAFVTELRHRRGGRTEAGILRIGL